MYGKAIGRKFEQDGSVRRYPGNTVIADVNPGCVAYDVMLRLRQMVVDSGVADHFILLPEDSYHMTVIQGLNDQVRTDEYWPAALSKDTPMTLVDDHVASAVESVGLPGPIRMRFKAVRFGRTCIMVKLIPADGEQERTLWDFRDRAAQAIGVYLPGHEDYGFHITLAYTRIIPEGGKARKIQLLAEEMERYITGQPTFKTTAPYIAYYDDMLKFSPNPIPRT